MPTHPATDNSTYANTDFIVDTHINLQWTTVDFIGNMITGTVTHDFNIIQDTSTYVLDMWNQTITSVEIVSAGTAKRLTEAAGEPIEMPGNTPLSWTVTTPNPGSGQVLTIDLLQEFPAGTSLSVMIGFVTAPDAMALTWMTPT